MYGEITAETPPFELLSKRQDYEIRRYRKQFWAQCTFDVPLDTDYSSGRNIGFFPLFNYISGNNNTQTKIAMTTPVISQETRTDRGLRRTMNFILSPSTFTAANQLPRANDNNVRLVEQSFSKPVACITFNMEMNSEGNVAKERELRQAAARDGISLSTNRSDVMILGYNAPGTLPQYRRNEICIPILN